MFFESLLIWKLKICWRFGASTVARYVRCIKDQEREVLLVVRETKHLWMRMEMGQDTYRLCFCWVSFWCYYGNISCLPSYLPTYLTTYLPLTYKVHLFAPGFAPEHTNAAPIRKNSQNIFSSSRAEGGNVKLFLCLM